MENDFHARHRRCKRKSTRTAGSIISSYALPEKVAFAEEPPRTSVGQIDKKGLRRKFGQ